MRIKSLMVCLSLFLLCAVSSQAERMGFKKLQLDDNVWEVRYVGNGFMSAIKVEKAFRCKTAKLAKMKGYSWFVLHLRGKDEHFALTGNNQTGVSSFNYYSAEGRVYLFHEEQDGDGEDLERKQFEVSKALKMWDCD